MGHVCNDWMMINGNLGNNVLVSNCWVDVGMEDRLVGWSELKPISQVYLMYNRHDMTTRSGDP